MKAILWAVSILMLTAIAHASHTHKESYYQGQWCQTNHGVMEVVLADGSRVDCVTSTHAVEFDFGAKWAESIGQSLHYSSMTGKRGGIVLITPEHSVYLRRVRGVVERHKLPIDVWSVEP